MSIYIVLLLLIFSFYFLFLYRSGGSNRKKRLFLFCSFSCLALVLGLRGEHVGEDTWHYSVELFERFKTISWKQVLLSPAGTEWSVWGEKIEYLFALLYKIVQVFSNSGQVFIFVVGALTCGFFARFIYVNIRKHVLFATLIFVCDSLFMGSFNGIRQMLALSIAINAYGPMENKKYKRAACVFIIAFFVHKSTIIIPLLFLLLLVKDKRRGIIYTAACTLAISLSIPLVTRLVSTILPRYSSYFSNNYWSNSLHGVIVLWVVILMISLYLFMKGIKTNQEYFGIIGTILYIGVEIIALRISAFTRIEYFFKSFLMMLFPACSERLNKTTRIIYYVFVFLLIFFEYLSASRIEYRQYSFFWN